MNEVLQDGVNFTPEEVELSLILHSSFNKHHTLLILLQDINAVITLWVDRANGMKCCLALHLLKVCMEGALGVLRYVPGNIL